MTFADRMARHPWQPIPHCPGRFRLAPPAPLLTPRELQALFPGVHGLPTTFVLDHDLRVVKEHLGLLDARVVEQEVGVLAGLMTATIERVDSYHAGELPKASLATELPGIDLDALPPAERAAVLMRVNTDACTCGCGLTLARCRIEDPHCTVSLPLAQAAVADIIFVPVSSCGRARPIIWRGVRATTSRTRTRMRMCRIVAAPRSARRSVNQHRLGKLRVPAEPERARRDNPGQVNRVRTFTHERLLADSPQPAVRVSHGFAGLA